MAYFSNGSEGDMYVEKYCEHCIHGKWARDDDVAMAGFCSPWFIHQEFNYEQQNIIQLRDAMNLLIPTINGQPGECSCFVDIDDGDRTPCLFEQKEGKNNAA